MEKNLNPQNGKMRAAKLPIHPLIIWVRVAFERDFPLKIVSPSYKGERSL